MDPAAEDGEAQRQRGQRQGQHQPVLRRFRRGRHLAGPALCHGPAQRGPLLAVEERSERTEPLPEAVEQPGRERHHRRGVEQEREDPPRIGLLVRVGAVVVEDEHVAQVLGRERQVVGDQPVDHASGEDGAGVRAQTVAQQLLEPHGAEEQERRQRRIRVVVELGDAEGEHRERDQQPAEQEDHRAFAGGLRAQPDARDDRGSAGDGEDPGEEIESDLLDEVDEVAARRAGVDADGEALEVVVDDEALEEGLAFVVAPVEGEHGAVPGRGDDEHDQRAGAQVQPPQPVPLAGGDAVDQCRRAGQGEAEQALGERGETDEAVEGRRPAVLLFALVEEHQHQAGHRAFEQADEDRIGHRLAGEEHEERAGEQRKGADHCRAPREQPVGHHERQDRAHRGDGGEGQPHAPLGIDAQPAIGSVGVRGQLAQHHQPEVAGGLAEEPARFPPGMDVVAAGDHLPGHLAVVRFPRIPEAGRAQPGDEEERGQRGEAHRQALLGAQRLKPAQPGSAGDPGGQRVAPVGGRAGCRLRLGGNFPLRTRHRPDAP